LSKATDEAKAERQRLLDDARKAADALSAKRQEALQSDATTSIKPSAVGPSRKYSPSRERR
jgi:hypothetical protein